MDKVRTAFIGVGYRGKQLFRLLQNIPFFQVQAVADPGVKSSEISGIPCYNQGEDACLDMLKEHHPELVFIASPGNTMCSMPCYVWSTGATWRWRLREGSILMNILL